MRGAVIDTMRSVSFERDVFGPDEPGWFVVVFDPVQKLADGNGYEIWPDVYETQEAARAAYEEVA
jgi:hypothetical protein